MSCPVIPLPARATPASGGFVLTAATPVRVASGDLEPVAAYLRGQLRCASHAARADAASAASPPGIDLRLDPALSGAEAYALHIDEAGITLAGGAAAGCFYAAQTLLQLLPVEVAAGGLVAGRDYHLSCGEYRDAPALGWRGMHLDCSRHFFPPDFIRRYIDLLAMHKMNRFHWHLTDDQGWRLEIARYPALTRIGAWRDRTVAGHTSDHPRRYREERHGGFYSRREVRDIVAYARERHVEVVPEIDIPGHAAALLAAHPELACRRREFQVESHFGIFPDVLCPREETFAFLEQVFTEVAELFPGDYVHIGGDEVVKTAWRECAHCQQLIRDRGLGDEDGLHGYFVARVAEILRGLGKRVVAWDEVLAGAVSRDTTVMCWNSDAGRRALEAGYPAVMTPVDTVYFDFYQSTSRDEPRAIHGLSTLGRVYHYRPQPAGLGGGEGGRVLGAQGNVWTEYLPTGDAVCYAALPRMSALAEALWCGERRDWADFCGRLPGLLARFDGLGVPAARSVYKPMAGVAEFSIDRLRATLDCEMPGVALHYTTDGSAPHAGSSRYTEPVEVSGYTILRAVGIDANGELHGDERLHLVAHRALRKPVYRFRDEGLQRAPELALLTNGCRGNERIFHYHEWAAFDGAEVDIVLDLEQALPVTSLAFNTQAGAHRHLPRPAGVRLCGSEDGVHWRALARLEGDAIPADGGVTLCCDGEPQRYLRLRLDNSQGHYSPETRREQRATLYLDELVVY
ncbi:beta-N-acetylhexosaminidase [Parahaliea mediterranea]|uniref:beta-N-acetylhexosaminidase n=1 Tax=Parahaliea mediterranea TaxID=651086 RepID=A0A939DBK7_9GAMM|nr:family 20 glycosylhydrolase [Parahaliea mediterranea]MBN7795055.1 family 20 glycosylhydrolase [Parahaliea mediterranea]